MPPTNHLANGGCHSKTCDHLREPGQLLFRQLAPELLGLFRGSSGTARDSLPCLSRGHAGQTRDWEDTRRGWPYRVHIIRLGGGSRTVQSEKLSAAWTMFKACLGDPALLPAPNSRCRRRISAFEKNGSAILSYGRLPWWRTHSCVPRRDSSRRQAGYAKIACATKARREVDIRLQGGRKTGKLKHALRLDFEW